MIQSTGNGKPVVNARTGPRGPVGWLLNLFSSLWTGITLLTLLFIYCSIGSAVPAVRQLPAIEMTEFEWFHWWPFDVLVALFCLNMAVITVRRIPLRKVNLGVWAIHSGIIIMTLGSYEYFGTKVEGDAPVFRRQIEINVPGASPTSLVAIPGSEETVTTPEGIWKFQVGSTKTDSEALDQQNNVVKCYEVMVMVTPPGGERFVRYLYDGQPHFTRDLIPGSGFASNAIGRRLVTDDLDLSLDYEPTTKFHVMDTWALFVRKKGTETWNERPIEGLPKYNDYIASRESVFTHPHHRLPLRPIDIEVPPTGDDVLNDAGVRITGYLRYAELRESWVDGGQWLNPVLKFSAMLQDGQSQSFELVAFDPANHQTPGGGAEFLWLEDKEQLTLLPTSTSGVMKIGVTATGNTITVPIDETTIVGSDGPLTDVEGTDLKYKVVAVPEPMNISGSMVSLVMVEIQTPEETFTRMVVDNPALTRDMAKGGGSDPHGKSRELDPRLTMTYAPGGARFIFAGYPGGLTFIHNGRDQRLVTKETRAGEVIELEQGAFRIDALMTHADHVVKPFVVPPERRNRDAGVTYAMIRLEVTGQDGKTVSDWVPFNRYAFPNNKYRYAGRFAYMPRTFHVGGQEVEVLFSRKTEPLPTAIALEDFTLDEHIGGYSGSASTIRNYHSDLRFKKDDGAWTDTKSIAVNNPTEFGGFWYFQSNWDPPSSQQPGSGMNFTGLGVGNRNGVYIQLAGSTISVIGMIFAFYIKPIMIRRRRLEAQAKLGASSEESVESPLRKPETIAG